MQVKDSKANIPFRLEGKLPAEAQAARAGARPSEARSCQADAAAKEVLIILKEFLPDKRPAAPNSNAQQMTHAFVREAHPNERACLKNTKNGDAPPLPGVEGRGKGTAGRPSANPAGPGCPTARDGEQDALEGPVLEAKLLAGPLIELLKAERPRELQMPPGADIFQFVLRLLQEVFPGKVRLLNLLKRRPRVKGQREGDEAGEETGDEGAGARRSARSVYSNADAVRIAIPGVIRTSDGRSVGCAVELNIKSIEGTARLPGGLMALEPVVIYFPGDAGELSDAGFSFAIERHDGPPAGTFAWTGDGRLIISLKEIGRDTSGRSVYGL